MAMSSALDTNGFLGLGTDIHKHIFSFISRKADLAKHATICKGLLDVVQQQLYNEICLDARKYEFVEDLYELVFTKSGRKLLGYVHKMTIKEEDNYWGTSGSNILAILEQTQVVHLRLAVEDMRKGEIRRLAKAVDITRFRRLDIAYETDLKRWLPLLRKVAPNIQTLDLMLTNGKPKMPIFEYPPFPEMKTLILDGSQAWWYSYDNDRKGAEKDTYSDEEAADQLGGVYQNYKRPVEEDEEDEGAGRYNHSADPDVNDEGRRRRPAWRDYNHLERLVQQSPKLYRIIEWDVPPTCISAIQSCCQNAPLLVKQKSPSAILLGGRSGLDVETMSRMIQAFAFDHVDKQDPDFDKEAMLRDMDNGGCTVS